MSKRAVIYARISVASEESVSIERQLEACDMYARARGWTVAGRFVDDGISASKNRPEDRAAWAALLASPDKYDKVIIWKVDRLARRVLDFLHADEALQGRGAGLVAVEDPIDMTTGQGRAFATMLAVFGELEAASIAARVKDARWKLVREGRAVGGTVPYGWCNVPNGTGGMVTVQDPERIGFVRGAVERVQGGATLYAVKQWLDAEGAPRPAGKGSEWSYSSVERLLRNPILAGMVPYNPGRVEATKHDKAASKARGAEVLRGPDGLPVVRPELAIMPVAEWRAMVARLDDRDSAQSRPRTACATTSPLLSGLMWCAACDARMHRGTTSGRPGYSCPSCSQTITNFEPLVVQQFLDRVGGLPRWTVITEVVEGGAAVLPEIEHRIRELTAELAATEDDDRADALTEQIAGLRAQRREARATAPEVRLVGVDEPVVTFAEAWAAAGTDVAAQRAVLDDALARIHVRRGGTGRRTPAQVLARLTFDWKNPTGAAA